eukprot:TRINITY_DN81873_c0_g1_i1.p1 TRINITY_DN81873_c0_g1~~TRINITY_DN81873_c0_g1_i1.p1  ORF type:complete len:377 (+),score=46.26 TRINITY_DN81873_c0_g1_i1:61-1191(+)
MDFHLPIGSRRLAKKYDMRIKGQAKHGRKKQKRLSDRLLHRQPYIWEVEEALAALELIAKCKDSIDLELEQVTQQESEDQSEKSDWDVLLRSVERNHGWRVRQELGTQTKFTPLYPNEAVQQRFLRAQGEFDHTVAVSYHGTKLHNVDSISRKGLIIPGRAGVTVANGSAHGLGVYTARIGAAQLSRGFCNSKTMFLCAVCDTSKPLQSLEPVHFQPSMTHVQTKFPPRGSLVRHSVKQWSDEVHHVGDAIVVFEERCVVPVFRLDIVEEKAKERAADSFVFHHHGAVTMDESRPELPRQVGRHRLVVPLLESHSKFVRPRTVGSAGEFSTVWLPPLPCPDMPGRARSIKLRRHKKLMWKEKRHGFHEQYWMDDCM